MILSFYVSIPDELALTLVVEIGFGLWRLYR